MEKPTKAIFLFVLQLAAYSSNAFAQNFSWSAPHVGGGFGSASSACEAVMGHYKATFPNYEFRMGSPFYTDTSSYYRRNYMGSVDDWDDSARSITCKIERKGAFGWFYGGVGAGEAISLKGDACPAGTTFGGDGVIGCTPNPTPNPGTNNGPPACSAGNPIDIATGNKFQEETDWVAPPNPLMKIQRTYNSSEGEWAFGYLENHIEVKAGSPRCALDPLDLSPLGCLALIKYEATLYSANGKASNFFSSPKSSLSGTTGYWASSKGTTFQLFKAAVYSDENVTLNDVFQRDLGQIIEVYSRDTNSSGNTAYQLRYIKSRQGYAISLDYDNQGVVVSDKHGNTLLLTLDGAGRVYKAITEDNTEFDYFYNDDGQLSQVTYPGATSRQYIYDETDSSLLVGIIDENGNRYATWAYDEAGRAILSEHANGVERTSLVFNSDGSISVTNALGLVTKYRFQTLDSGLKVPVLVEGFESENCIASNSSYSYDENGYRDLVTDRNGNVTDYDYDDQNSLQKITEGLRWSNGPYSSVITTQDTQTTELDWRAGTNLLEEKRVPGITTHYDYWPNNQLAAVTQTDTTNFTNSFGSTLGRVRAWNYTYTYHDAGETILATKIVNGPLDPATQSDGIDDITVYTYNTQGQMTQVQNAYGHTTRYQDYLNSGEPQTIIDANNVVTRLTYTPRGWLDTVTVETSAGNAVTDYDYYPNGLLQRVTLPNNSSLTYEYNDAKQLTAVVNNLNERMEFDPSLLNGEWTRFDVKNASGTIVRTHQRVQDELGRVKQLLNPDLSTDVEYWYDGEGNLDLKHSLSGPSVTSPNVVETDFNYNALNQISETVDAMSALTKIDHDGNGNVESVTDARNNTTTYIRDGFGQVIRQQSPDTGTTDFWFDAAGNLTQKLDGRGVTTTYRFDALSRQVSEQYSNDSAINLTFQYDQTTVQGEISKGIGRHSAILRTGANVYYVHDDRGNIIADIHSVGTVNYATRYQYSKASFLEKMIYPSGRIVNYTPDALGRIQSITTQDSPTATVYTLAGNVAYEPFGPIKGFTYRNGIQNSRLYDGEGRLTDIIDRYSTTTYQNIHLDYDWAGNIERIEDRVTPANNQVFGYNDVDRLLNATGSYGALAYSYDLVGNRLTADTVTATSTVKELYTIPSSSNRLATHSRQTGTTTPVVRNWSYTGAGNATGTTNHTITYDGANRIRTVRRSTTTMQFAYNGLGQRINKWNVASPSGAIHFHYDLNGQLIAETTATGTTRRDYVWLGDILVAIQTGNLGSTAQYAVHSNHLNAPQRMTTSSRGTNWRGVYSPYGSLRVVTGGIGNNLRLPGQYFDTETQLHYNYFRDYDPSLGRYVQSDPIGLRGGVNTYGYVGGNPLIYYDPYGLWKNPFSINNDSRNAAADKYPTNFAKQDAYRHCLASCSNAKENGKVLSILGGIANEAKGNANGQKSGDKDMDDWNNACGIYASEKDASCPETCDSLLNGGVLDTSSYGAGNKYHEY